MEHKLMKRAAVWCLCFFAAAMGIMIYLSFQKSALPPGAEPVSAQAQEKESASEDGDEAEAETQRPMGVKPGILPSRIITWIRKCGF